MTQPVIRFRTKILEPAIRVAFWNTILLEALIWIDHRDDPVAEVLIRHLIILSVFWMFWVVFFALESLFCRVRITPSGIRYPDWSWLVREVLWDEIGTVQRVNLLGIRFLAIYPVGREFGIWVPLFLRDEDGFWCVVKACVPVHHPLRKHCTSD